MKSDSVSSGLRQSDDGHTLDSEMKNRSLLCFKAINIKEWDRDEVHSHHAKLNENDEKKTFFMSLNIFQFIKNDDSIIANEMCFSTEVLSSIIKVVHIQKRQLIDFNSCRFISNLTAKLHKRSQHVKQSFFSKCVNGRKHKQREPEKKVRSDSINHQCLRIACWYANKHWKTLRERENKLLFSWDQDH